jgi:hypothetical protein
MEEAMNRILWVSAAVLAAVVGCGGSSDDHDDGGVGDVAAEDAAADVPADVPMDVPADVPADAPMDVPMDVPADVPADVPSDAPPDGPDPCLVEPTARENGAYAVTRIEVVAPDVFGSVLPTLTGRILSADISVVLATDLERADTGFALEAGQAIEYLSPTRRARFCKDEFCGYPPNVVSGWAADVDDCNGFSTAEPATLVFSLYPPSHPGAATPLRLVDVRVRGRFDADRSHVVEGVLTGAILRDQTPTVFPALSLSLADLVRAAGIEADYDEDEDTHPDGWTVEIRFEAEWIEFIR